MTPNEHALRAVAAEEMRIKLDVLTRLVMRLPGADSIDLDAVQAEATAALKIPLTENIEPRYQQKMVVEIIGNLRR